MSNNQKNETLAAEGSSEGGLLRYQDDRISRRATAARSDMEGDWRQRMKLRQVSSRSRPLLGLTLLKIGVMDYLGA